MIPVVLEPSCLSPSEWPGGTVQGKLGSKMYINLSSDHFFSTGIELLSEEIKKIRSRERISWNRLTMQLMELKRLGTLQNPTKSLAQTSELVNPTVYTKRGNRRAAKTVRLWRYITRVFSETLHSGRTHMHYFTAKPRKPS